jgi:methionyl-tRNA formyltransferase
MYKGERIKVLHTTLVMGIAAAPGTVLDNALTVACGSGALRLEVLQRPGGKPLAAEDFLNGYPLSSGTNLT